MPSSIGGILGGGGSKSSSTQASGYSALPPELMAAFNKLGLNVEKFTNPDNAGVIDRFTPLAQTADESAAFNKIRQGFTPTAQSLASDIAMQQNPYDQYVIDAINREAQGNNSILNQNLNRAGQFGSNRGMLGANDIDLTRLQQIGQFKQNQFNTALNNAMTVLPTSRANDAQGLLGIGSFQRGLDYQTQQAPISALQAGTGMIAPFTAGGTLTQKQSGGGDGMLGGLGSLANLASTAYTFFSDMRIKENINPIGTENGHKMYEFSYLGNPMRYIGVMAQDVLEYAPEAVREIDGYYAVNYAMLGVKMREAYHG